ncbi:MAG: DUF1240 domain-containing protein [Enterobacteriaceae bacterium]|nr:DUF1240 domain-containing protein [Enterobacteriaceae bacterium]
MSIAIFGGLGSIINYRDFLTRSDLIEFSTISVWFIWCSPFSMYFSLLSFKYLLTNKPVVFNNKIGICFVFIGIIGFVFSLFSSFYVDFKLRSEHYIMCSKSSWVAPNKYVKDISLCE